MLRCFVSGKKELLEDNNVGEWARAVNDPGSAGVVDADADIGGRLVVCKIVSADLIETSRQGTAHQES